MPADYESTARSLSISPRPSLSLSSSSSPAPPWARERTSPTPTSVASPALGANTPRISQRSTRFNNYSSGLSVGGNASLWERAQEYGMTVYTNAMRRFLALPPGQRVCAAIGVVVVGVLGLVMMFKWHGIVQAMIPIVKKWRDIRGGWLIVWFMVFMTSFPPIIGYSTAGMIAGFVYGFPGAWPIVASACVVGSSLSFLTSRTIFSGYVHRLVGQDPRFVALGQVLRRDGLVMLTAIRFCPLPFSLSNGFLATIPTITPAAFALSTTLSTPKLLIHVWLASRLALLAENGDTMSFGEKFVNYLSMAIAGTIGVTVTIVIYRRTMSRAAELVHEGDVGGEDNGDLERGLISGNRLEDVQADEDAISMWGVDQEDDDDEDDAYRDRAYDDIMGKPGGLLH